MGLSEVGIYEVQNWVSSIVGPSRVVIYKLGELHRGLQPGDIGEVDDGKITSPVDRSGDRPPTVPVPRAWPPICK